MGGELLPFVPVALAKIYVGISTFRRGPKSYLKGMIKAHPRRRFSKSSLFRVDIPIPSTEECPGFFEESSKSSVKRYDDRVKVPWGLVGRYDLGDYLSVTGEIIPLSYLIEIYIGIQ